MAIDATTPWEALTPLSFLERSGAVFADRTAFIDGASRLTYGELFDRVRRLAGALREQGIGPGDFVAVLAPNRHHLLEAHFGVPATGATVVPLNTRLATPELTYILEHCGARTLLVADERAERGVPAADDAAHDIEVVHLGGSRDTYEQLLAAARPWWQRPDDEGSLLAVNYTSGTTGRPKGVMYHHRGAYLQGMAMALHSRLSSDSTFLWTLPMFHCNGWCFPYAVTAVGATHVGLPRVDPAEIWRLIEEHDVSHLNAAPTVLIDLVRHPDARPRPEHRPIQVATGGAPPSPTLLEQLADLRIEVTHLYGLTETFGPSVICEEPPEWRDLPADQLARRKARQGVPNAVGGRIRVIAPEGTDVPADGQAMGEVALRGNTIMAGYLHDAEATRQAIPDGWFRTGDLGVMHPDGYVELRDRSKDIIVSGGENIASIEVEQAIASHPAVAEAAVVAGQHPRWGETPVAFVTLHADATVSAEDLIAHTKQRIASYKAPTRVEFRELPRTSTGKIQKYRLRELANDAE